MTDINGKRILITGGAGTIGQELTSYILRNKYPLGVTIVDKNNSSLKHLKYKEPNIQVLCGDIRSIETLRNCIKNIDIIFHLAAEKDVVFCEKNHYDAISTNFSATKLLLKLAQENNVKQFIFTSSDKAVYPSNLMGRTKYLAERLIINTAHKSYNKMKCSIVRFGNILGSSGSVSEIFTNQINNRVDITITHPNMTRFIMSKSEAVKLLVKSTNISTNGSILVMDMPVARIIDIAKIMLSKTIHNLSIEFIGIRDGETLYESLMTDEEIKRAKKIEKFFVISGNTIKDHNILNLTTTSNKITPLNKRQLTKLLKNSGIFDNIK